MYNPIPHAIMNTVKATKFLAQSKREFFESHIEISKSIFDRISNRHWPQLAELMRPLMGSDKEMIHYAFFDLYGFDYELKIRSEIGGFAGMKKYGFV